MEQIRQGQLDEVRPHLSVVTVVGLEDGTPRPDPQVDSLRAELRTRQAHDPEGFRWLMVAIVRQGAWYIGPEFPAVQAAIWYRQQSGEAAPILGTLQDLPSDQFLIPLSAIKRPLSRAEQAFLLRVGCDLAAPLLAWKRGSGSAKPGAGYLEWPERSERILRHIERLVGGPRAPSVAALIAAVQPRAVKLDPERFVSSSP